jgi:hypothetical protein
MQHVRAIGRLGVKKAKEVGREAEITVNLVAQKLHFQAIAHKSKKRYEHNSDEVEEK